MSTGGAAEIVFDRVTKRYEGRDQAAVENLSLTIPAGEICVLVGPSGAGKTTAMKLVNRLIELDEGDIVCLLADGGWKYLSTQAWSQDLAAAEHGVEESLWW